MKKCTLFIICIFILNQKISGQVNLVPNPSFETYTTCPDFAGQLYYASPWFQPNNIGGSVTTGSSSDFYNICAPYGQTSVPSNNYTGGIQFPKTGNGYAGILLYSGSSGTGLREYIESSLTSTLIQGKKYCVEFYVSLIDTVVCGISNMGAFFSNDSLLYNDILYSTIPVIAQVSNDTNNIVTDKINWTLISGQFIASGGERYITIGNFETDANTIFQTVVGSLAGSYYYIDDISVICCDCDTAVITNIIIPNIFTPNNDNINDFFEIENLPSNATTQIFNRWGIKVFETNKSDTFWDGRTTSGNESVDGTYFYLIKTKEKTYKGFVQLIR